MVEGEEKFTSERRWKDIRVIIACVGYIIQGPLRETGIGRRKVRARQVSTVTSVENSNLQLCLVTINIKYDYLA